MKSILFLTILSLISDLSLQSNPYCDLNSCNTACKHTAFQKEDCKDKNPQVLSLTQKDKDALVACHNAIRETAASGKETGAKDGRLPQASNMRKLVWNDDLAHVAQALAYTCRFAHDENKCRGVLYGRFKTVGQNLAYAATTAENPSFDLCEVITPWYTDEVKYFPSDIISKFSSKNLHAYGHYSQVIWAESEAVGCGGALTKSGKWNEITIVCNYGEAGNLLGAPVYKKGKPCSACPSGTSCSGSLCEKK